MTLFSALASGQQSVQQTPPTPPPAAPDPQASAPPVPAPPATGAPVPDWEDKRTLTLGVFYWLTIPGNGPDIRGGKIATSYESLYGLGGAKKTPGVEVSLPITRTGALHFEGFQTKGDGNQKAPQDTTVFSSSFSKGDYFATQYRIRAGKLYLDDLLYPFKFPVAKFRVKSLWEIQYIDIKTDIAAPLRALTDSSGNVLASSATGSRSIIFPTFGLAAEYAIAPHVLLRGAASGFALPHRAEIWDAEGTVAWRIGKAEIVGGFKILHFKTSPQKEEYIIETLDGGFVSARWHF